MNNPQVFNVCRAPEHPPLTEKQLRDLLWAAFPKSEWEVREQPVQAPDVCRWEPSKTGSQFYDGDLCYKTLCGTYVMDSGEKDCRYCGRRIVRLNVE